MGSGRDSNAGPLANLHRVRPKRESYFNTLLVTGFHHCWKIHHKPTRPLERSSLSEILVTILVNKSQF